MGGWSCADSADDDYLLDSADDSVRVTGGLIFTPGSLTLLAGVLEIDPGTTIFWLGPDDGTQDLIEGDRRVEMEGQVLWGRPVVRELGGVGRACSRPVWDCRRT